MATTEGGSTPTVVSRDEWIVARTAFMDREKAFTRQRDELSQARRELPWTEVTEPYEFEGPDGVISLSELFGDHSQLLLWHFMMGPDWEEGCPSCSFWADNYDGVLPHLAARDTALVAVARAPLGAIEAYRNRMGWTFPWYSSQNSSFNFDFAVSFSAEEVASGGNAYNYETQTGMEEMPGLSVFCKTEDGRINLTYQTFSRGLDMLNGTYHMLDLTSKGRDEQDLPWTMAWLRRHDSYDS